jgi:tetratricopeptide (TPR) repeat protein
MIRALVLLPFLLLPLASTSVFAQVTKQKSYEQLKSDLDKIERSIEATKLKMRTIKDAKFLPDLYFVLAELHVDKSRYMYTIKVIENKGTPIEELDFVNEKRPKLQAIDIYQTILDKFPRLKDRDRALFLMAHEHRELGQLEEMIRIYQKLTQRYPQSPFWPESQLIIAGYFFENKKDIPYAVQLYKKLLRRRVGPFTPIAQYKLGWCYINLDKWKEALLSFEAVLTQSKGVDLSKLPEIYRKTDVRRDALNALVWPYSEIKPKKLAKMGRWRVDPIRYVKALSNNKVSYRLVLRKLGQRLSIKHRYIAATRAYLEALKFTEDTEMRMEAIDKIYENMKNSKKRWPVVGYTREVAKTLHRLKHDRRIDSKDRREALKNYEIYLRDAATRMQERAKKSRKKSDYLLAIEDYKNYLDVYPKTKYTKKMLLNLAESYFNIRGHVNAGQFYEKTGRKTKKKRIKQQYYDSALQAYITALKKPEKLSRLEITKARYGLRQVGSYFARVFPRHKAVPNVLFTIGRTYYDERLFDKAVKGLFRYIDRFPRGKNVKLAVDLILDSYNQREDYDGLTRAGNRITKNKKLAKSIRSNVSTIVRQAQYKKMQAKAGDFSSPKYAKRLLKFASKYKGSSLGDKALYEAFVNLKSKRDPEAYDPGEALLMRYGNSKYAKDVVTEMGKMALITADFRRAAKYFEAYHERYPRSSGAKDYLKNAAEMREYMGDFAEAAQNYNALGMRQSVARIHYQANNWTALAKTARGVGGVKGSYWSGLARYRLGDGASAKKYFFQTIKQRPRGYEETNMVAHARYLLAMNAMRSYESVRMVEGQETQAIQTKDNMRKALESELNKVLKTGSGRWTIAALYGLGKANDEFASFILDAPIPKEIPRAQVREYKQLIKQQAKPFRKAAKGFFRKCISSAEKFEVFSRFVRGCQTFGEERVDEESEMTTRSRAADMSPSTANAIRKRLYDSPRNVSILNSLAESYSDAGDYAMSNLILNRALEIRKNHANSLARQGMNLIAMNDFENAKLKFKAALKSSKRNPTALWGMAALYKKFDYTSKFRRTRSKARRAGRPLPPMPALVRQAL